MHQFSTHNYFYGTFLQTNAVCTFQSKGRSKLCTLQIISIHHYLHKQKIVGEWLIMSLPVLIAQTECKLHLYELLFPLSSLRQEAAIHSASLVYLHYVDPHTILPLTVALEVASKHCTLVGFAHYTSAGFVVIH